MKCLFFVLFRMEGNRVFCCVSSSHKNNERRATCNGVQDNHMQKGYVVSSCDWVIGSIGSKWCMLDVAASMCAVKATMWDLASDVWAIIATMWAESRHVGCYSHHACC